jgi:NADH-quinone oxidoreductase subunit H
MQAFIDQLIQEGAFAGVPREVVYAIAMVLTALIVLSVFVAPLAGVTSWLERRVGRACNRASVPTESVRRGVLQWLADGIKNLLKEDLIPQRRTPSCFHSPPMSSSWDFFARSW